MPRRKVARDQGDAIPILMLPPAKSTHRHARDHDAYEVPPGAVPTQVIATEPLGRKLTAEERKDQHLVQQEHQRLEARYERYLDLLGAAGGNRAAALAEIFGLPIDEVYPQMPALLAAVREGLRTGALGDALEQNALGVNERVRILRHHAYNLENPAASLKAVDMAHEMQGQTSDGGSFEHFIRAAKLQKG